VPTSRAALRSAFSGPDSASRRLQQHTTVQRQCAGQVRPEQHAHATHMLFWPLCSWLSGTPLTLVARWRARSTRSSCTALPGRLG
jgi:hypothetical protein